MLGGSQEADAGGYRAHPQAVAHYGGQYSSVYGSAALSGAQQVSELYFLIFFFFLFWLLMHYLISAQQNLIPDILLGVALGQSYFSASKEFIIYFISCLMTLMPHIILIDYMPLCIRGKTLVGDLSTSCAYILSTMLPKQLTMYRVVLLEGDNIIT